ncbi:hypothetical protein FPHYL_8830 [Fusarium phyllophilum]|uniref:Uncharacterized protein n=1 Tax=Fusarium phyllophilum TaxID=47803 RepID=A0A8H5N630_9HYPO|nr:hypothetical protein FPHYL_8830 [Fusarium phyllophilum]
MKTTTALLALAAAAEASPLFSKRDDVFDDKQKFCKGWDLKTVEGVDKLWEDTAAGVSLELFIKSHWAAATMGNALGGLVPGVGSGISAGMGILAGIMSGLSLGDDEDDGVATISAGLADLFKSASVKLEDTLRIATGGGRNDDEYNSLPAPKWDTYETKIAKFFKGGWFLLDDDVETVRVTLGSITNNIQKKVANDVMKASKLHLVADKLGGKDSREDCGFSTGHQ